MLTTILDNQGGGGDALEVVSDSVLRSKFEGRQGFPVATNAETHPFARIRRRRTQIDVGARCVNLKKKKDKKRNKRRFCILRVTLNCKYIDLFTKRERITIYFSFL